MKINEPCISSTVDEQGPIYVYQTRTSLILSFDGKVYQSSMKLKNVNGLDLDYTQAMMTGLMFIPEVKTATIMGLGGGSLAKNLLSNFSDLTVHAVEYREEVVKVAKNIFISPIQIALSFISTTLRTISKTPTSKATSSFQISTARKEWTRNRCTHLICAIVKRPSINTASSCSTFAVPHWIRRKS